MAEHEMGTMDTREHEKVFEGFVKFCARAAIAVILLLAFIALVNA